MGETRIFIDWLHKIALGSSNRFPEDFACYLTEGETGR